MALVRVIGEALWIVVRDRLGGLHVEERRVVKEETCVPAATLSGRVDAGAATKWRDGNGQRRRSTEDSGREQSAFIHILSFLPLTDLHTLIPATMSPSPPVRMPRVILVRHGETEWSLSGQHTGETDIPLTAHGEEVMARLAPTFVGVNSPEGDKQDRRFTVDPTRISHIWTSPRTRSRRTLQLLLAHLTEHELANVVQPEVKPECQEWRYGFAEGRKTGEIRQEWPGWDIWVDGTKDHATRPELKGESAEDMTKRIDGTIAEIKRLQKAVIEGHPERTHDQAVMQKGGDVMIVSHGHHSR